VFVRVSISLSLSLSLSPPLASEETVVETDFLLWPGVDWARVVVCVYAGGSEDFGLRGCVIKLPG